MAYDEHLAERISKTLKEKRVKFETKNMMGGLCYLIDNKMAVGIVKNELMARIGPEPYETALKKKGCRPMDFTGKPMVGYVFVDSVEIDIDNDLDYWIQLCVDFNPKAKLSKKAAPKKTHPKAAAKKKKR